MRILDKLNQFSDLSLHTMSSKDHPTSFDLDDRDDMAKQIESEPVLEKGTDVSVEEKRLVRKLDMRILPITCFLYLLACLCLSVRRHSERLLTCLFSSLGQIQLG